MYGGFGVFLFHSFTPGVLVRTPIWPFSPRSLLSFFQATRRDDGGALSGNAPFLGALSPWGAHRNAEYSATRAAHAIAPLPNRELHRRVSKP